MGNNNYAEIMRLAHEIEGRLDTVDEYFRAIGTGAGIRGSFRIATAQTRMVVELKRMQGIFKKLGKLSKGDYGDAEKKEIEQMAARLTARFEAYAAMIKGANKVAEDFNSALKK